MSPRELLSVFIQQTERTAFIEGTPFYSFLLAFLSRDSIYLVDIGDSILFTAFYSGDSILEDGIFT